MSSLINNDPDSVRIRKNKGTLLITGAGVAAFGIWSVIKVVMEFMLAPVDEELAAYFIEVGEGGAVFIGAFMAVVIMIDVILRIFIFTCARKESRGEKAKGLIFLSALVISGSLFSLVYVLVSSLSGVYYELSMTDEVSLFVELTSLVVTVEMIAASIGNRRLLAKKQKEAAAGAA